MGVNTLAFPAAERPPCSMLNTWFIRLNRCGRNTSLRRRVGLPEERVHGGEEALRLGLLDFLRRSLLRAGKVDHVQQRGGDVVEEARRRAGDGLAPPRPLCGAGEDEPLPRAGQTHV